VRVRVQAVALPARGQVAPSGVDDQTPHRGWVKVGRDHDTAAFAVASSRRWWTTRGPQVDPHAQRLLITADSGGSTGDRTRLWKTEWQKVATDTGREIAVCHRPPGTSPWHTIAHRLLSDISQTWRGNPLVSHEVRVHLMASTTPRTGLTVRCELDTDQDPQGIRITDKALQQGHILREPCHGAWKYTIKPLSS
jgi:hypothetical protein